MFYQFPNFNSYNYSFSLLKAGSIILANISLVFLSVFCFDISFLRMQEAHMQTAET